ncbi:MAG: tetratricopeptide repeat protein [Crocinitomix sp.]|nr:tetratricopeptide repeat protein [Crocinitomix sp.]
MKVLLSILSIFIMCCTYAQDSSFVRGNEAYANADYETALVEYSKVVSSEQISTALYYNLGNTYYKLEQLGEAIWAYEKALKIDPSNENAQFNLKFANAKTYDDLDTSESGIVAWLKINFFSFSINFWAYGSILFAFILAITLYFFFTTKKQKVKNRSLTLSFGALFLLALLIVLAYLNQSNIIDRDQAVIITEFVEVRSSPSDTAASSFKLHEGTKVDLLRSSDGWTEIGVNGNTGWIEKTAIWEI